jgi:hypothetical protein
MVDTDIGNRGYKPREQASSTNNKADILAAQLRVWNNTKNNSKL